MKDREDIMEKIEGGTLGDDLFSEAEKCTFALLRQSIIPLWKGSALYREGLRLHGVADIHELRPDRKGSKTGGKSHQEEHQRSPHNTLVHQETT